MFSKACGYQLVPMGEFAASPAPTPEHAGEFDLVTVKEGGPSAVLRAQGPCTRQSRRKDSPDLQTPAARNLSLNTLSFAGRASRLGSAQCIPCRSQLAISSPGCLGDVPGASLCRCCACVSVSVSIAALTACEPCCSSAQSCAIFRTSVRLGRSDAPPICGACAVAGPLPRRHVPLFSWCALSARGWLGWLPRPWCAARAFGIPTPVMGGGTSRWGGKTGSSQAPGFRAHVSVLQRMRLALRIRRCAWAKASAYSRTRGCRRPG